MKKHTATLVAILTFALAPFIPAHAIQIDLNDFFADPSVTVAADGSSAVMGEDPFFSTVLLSNDPGLGDPEVIIAGPGQILSFDYWFDEPPSNDEEFGAYVLDSSGASAGAAYEFFTDSPGSGTVSFDLSGLTGETIGLQFELSSWFGDLASTSTLTISNVTVEPIPEPATLLLVGTGLVGLIGLRRKKFRKIA